MSAPTTKVKAAKVSKAFEDALCQFKAVTGDTEAAEVKDITRRLDRDLRDHRARGTLTVAFVGQYSAGKSTIISALTDRRDIKIDTDIATGETTEYEWNGIKIIDTPGLFTERDDHDDITYEAIKKADLLVFCVTYMLFDSVTVENFKKLAYEMDYRGKMMLVVNKMADEAGEVDERVENYRTSMSDALRPYSIDEFPVCFIDALDYIDGVDDDDEFLITESRFETFISQLNTFVEERGVLGRLDTPIRLLMGAVDETSAILARDEVEDSAYFELLNRIGRTIRLNRQRFRRSVRRMTSDTAAQINALGSSITLDLGSCSEDEFKEKLSDAEDKITKLADATSEEFERVANKSARDLQGEVEDLLSGDLAAAFAAKVKADPSFETRGVDVDNPWGARLDQLNQLRSIGNQLGISPTLIEGLASGPKASAAAGNAFLKAGQVSGSALHQTVYNVGKFVGVKFKPWQAVNFAKTIGNAAKIAGPILSILVVFLEVSEARQDSKNAQKLAKARASLLAEFRELAENLEKQFDEQRRNAEAELFDPVELLTNQARQAEEAKVAESNEQVGQLNEIRSGMRVVLGEIFA